MQFFSDEYLMHYGIKGMKWKKKNAKTPGEYLEEAYDSIRPEGEAKKLHEYTGLSGAARRHHARLANYSYATSNHPSDPRIRFLSARNKARAKVAESIADKNRNADLKKARKKAYKKNQKRIAKQQRKAKVKNALKRVKNKVFVDTSGSKKIGNHLYVEHH